MLKAGNVAISFDRPRSLAGIPLGLLLFLVVILPSFFWYFGMSSSMALGTVVITLFVIGASVMRGTTRRYSVRKGRISVGVFILLIVSVLSLHILIAAFISPINFERAAYSLVPLVLILFAGFRMARLLAILPDKVVNQALYLCFGLMSVVGLVAAAGYIPPISVNYFKPVFPFTEPSHFALAFLPFLMYVCVRLSGVAKVSMLVSGLAMALALESLSFLAGWCLILLISVRLYILSALLPFLALLTTRLDASYYLDRVDFTSENTNLSTLVYLQGWQMIDEAFAQSNGWGQGFQQLGINGSNTLAGGKIFALLGANSNLLDGGFTFAKITSEFGWLALPLMVLYIRIAVHSAKLLRRRGLTKSREKAAVTFAQCVVLCFTIELFVRGAGYFSGTSLFLVASIFTLWLQSSAPFFNRRVGGCAVDISNNSQQKTVKIK